MSDTTFIEPVNREHTRLPPHNIDAEQGLLGALMLNNKLLDEVGDLIEPAQFYDPLHGQIYEAILRMYQAGRLANAITLRTVFEGSEPVNDETPVPLYMARLMGAACVPQSAPHYARTIADLAIRRDIIRLAENVSVAAQDAPAEHPPEELIADAEQALFKLGEGKHDKGWVSLSQTITEVIGKINAAYQRNADLAGLPTGLADLDAKLGGLQASDLIIVAGRPSMGKTSLALDIADFLARQGLPVGGFSLEMSGAQLSMRLLSQRAEIASDRLRRGNISEDEFRNLVEHAKEVQKLPLIIDESGGLSLAQLASRARRMKRKHKIGLLVIDYLQLLHGSKRENRTQDVTEITMGLKALAKELDVPVIALSQLSRGPEQRSDKRPQLADLRESGSIEQDADVVMFVYREEYYVEREKPADADLDKLLEWQQRMKNAHGKAEIIIAKNRNGPVGSIEVAFDAALTRFSNMAREYRMPEEARHG